MFWGTPEKEISSLTFALTRLRHIVAERHVVVYTDHRNHQFLLSSVTPKSTVDRLMRWALVLMEFDLKVVFLSGARNALADVLTRKFGIHPRLSFPATVVSRVGLDGSPLPRGVFRFVVPGTPDVPLVAAMVTRAAAASAGPAGVGGGGADVVLPPVAVAPALAPPVVMPGVESLPASRAVVVYQRRLQQFGPAAVLSLPWAEGPLVGDIAQAQHDALAGGAVFPPALALAVDPADDLWRMTDGSRRVYVPDVGALRLRVLVAAHQGAAGHRARRVTYSVVAALFVWVDLAADVKEFCRLCVYCQHAVPMRRVVRPLAEAMHALVPGALLHADFLFVVKEVGVDCSYVLVLRDDFSAFCRLVATQSCVAKDVCDALLAWCNDYGVVSTLYVDGGSHFTADVVQRLASELGIVVHVTTAYHPQSHGTAERQVALVLRTMQTLVEEARVPFAEWPRVLPLAQYALNTQPSPRLGMLTPFLVFFGRQPVRSVDAVLSDGDPAASGVSVFPVSPVRVRELAADFVELVRGMHAVVGQLVTQQRATRRAPALQQPLFPDGSYVLVARLSKERDKLLGAWSGPAVVESCVPDTGYLVYRVRHLPGGPVSSVHAERLRFYADASLNVTVELRELVARRVAGGDGDQYLVEKIDGVREVAGGFELCVLWLGFDPLEHSWLPLSYLLTVVPRLVRAYVKRMPPSDLKTRLTALCR